MSSEDRGGETTSIKKIFCPTSNTFLAAVSIEYRGVYVLFRIYLVTKKLYICQAIFGKGCLFRETLFRILVDQLTRACEKTIEWVPGHQVHLVRAGQPHPFRPWSTVCLGPKIKDCPEMTRPRFLCTLLEASGS